MAKCIPGVRGMFRLLIMRHGESEADLPPQRLEGNADFALTERGRQQAAALAARLAAEYRLDALFTSQLRRARETAEAITAATGVAAETDNRLRERSYGRLAGKPISEVQAKHPLPPWGRRLHERAPGGESRLEQIGRVSEFWYELYYGERTGTVGLVTHGGSIQCLYDAALGLPVLQPIAFGCDDTSLHEWRVEPAGRVLVALANCTRHLTPELRRYPDRV